VKGAGGVAGNRFRKYFFKSIRIVAWITVALIASSLLLIIAIRIPAVQQAVVQRATSYLENRIGTPVSIGRVLISFPKSLLVEEIYLEDQQGDTLLYAQKLEVNAGILAVLQRRIAIKDVGLTTARIFVSRDKADTLFNYSYIVEAFMSGEDSVKVEEDDAKAWAISLDNLSIGNSFVDYRDRLEGTDFTTYVGKLEVVSRETNLVDNIYKLRKVELSDADIFISLSSSDTIDAETPDEADTTSAPLVADFSELAANNVTFRLVTPTQQTMVDLGRLIVQSRDMNLSAQSIDLREVTLENSTLSHFTHDPGAASEVETTASSTDTLEISPWEVAVGKLTLAGNTIRYYNLAEKIQQKGFDPNRIWISGFDAVISDIAVGKTNAKASIDEMRLNERSGLVVRKLEGRFALSDQHASISAFHGAVNRSDLNLDATLKFTSLEKLADAGVDFTLGRSTLYPTDILAFYPSALDSVPVTFKANDKIVLSGGASGTLKNAKLDGLSVDALDSTRLRVSGYVRGLPDVERTSFTLSLKELSTTRGNIRRMLPDSLMPTGIQLPAAMHLSGSFSGTYQKPSLDAVLATSHGDILAKGELNLNGKGAYNLNVEARELALGKILVNPELGDINLKAKVIGQGKTMQDLDAEVNMLLSRLTYKGYNYKELRLDGRLTRYLFDGSIIMEDENLDFTLKAKLDYGEEVPTYFLTLDMKNIDMKALQLTERPLRARATLDVDLATADFKAVNGRVDLRKVAVFNGAKMYSIDSLLVASIDQVGESSIEIRSDIMTGDFKGTINIFTLPTALRQHFNRYFSLNDSTIEDPKDLQQFDFDLTLKNTDLLTEVLFPPLEPFKPGKIYGSFNSEEQKLDMQIRISDVAYDGLSADSVSMIVNSDTQKLEYLFGVKRIKVDTLRIHDLKFNGTAANDTLSTSFRVLDSLENETYLVGSILTRTPEALRLSLHEVVLNASEWDVPPKNSLQFGANGMTADNFSISKDNQRIALETSARDSLVNIIFKELELGNLTRIISGAVPASGELNGELKFSTSNSGNFNSRLDITSLTVLHKPWGDLNLTLKHANERYDYDLKLRGNQTRLEASGNYAIVGDSAVITLAAKIPSLNLELIEPFTGGQAKKMQGIIEGEMNVYGALPSIDIRGDLSFRDATFEAAYLNSPFELTYETISFREQGIVFNDFQILDRDKNKAIISGVIETDKYRRFDLDLKITANNFQVLNKPEAPDQTIFGILKLNVDATITGPYTHPAVQITAGMSPDSDVTYVIPQSEAGILEQQGIVKFVDKDAINDPFLKEVKPNESLAQGFKGIELNAIIELRGRETLNIIIDPETGDKLTVRGRASLNLGIDPSGNMNLSGRYEISDGMYNLSFYKLVKREFEIVKGGTIIWSGDPLRGALDLSALYSVEAAPLELVANQLTSSDESIMAPYRQRMPFLVYLNLGGELMAPEVGFRLDMPEEKRNVLGGVVYGRIQDISTKEAELNKQVFGLLILKSFVAENPLEGSSGGDIENSARLSASRMLSQQLNRLSSRIKGVELSLNVKSYEDYTRSQGGEGKTEAQLGVSKTLFGDRLVVKLSGNVDIEGESQQSNVTDYIGDIALEYKMTPDGRFRLTGFRNSNYDMIDGELTETGAGVIYIKDYNALRELFKANETPIR
jgi:translocation and assembly module TamB